MREYKDKSKRGLIITRKTGERVAISGDVILEIANIKGKAARLRFIASDCTKIKRLDKEDDI